MKIEWIPRHMAPTRQHLINLEHDLAFWKSLAETASRNTAVLQRALEDANDCIDRDHLDALKDERVATERLESERRAHGKTKDELEQLALWRFWLGVVLIVLGFGFAAVTAVCIKRGHEISDLLQDCSPSGETVTGVR